MTIALIIIIYTVIFKKSKQIIIIKSIDINACNKSKLNYNKYIRKNKIYWLRLMYKSIKVSLKICKLFI